MTLYRNLKVFDVVVPRKRASLARLVILTNQV